MGWLSLVMVATLAADAGEPTCVIEGDAAFSVMTVRPKGAPSFELGVPQRHAKATLPKRHGQAVLLEFGAPMAFRAESKNVWLSVKERYVSPDGLVVLEPGAQLVQPRVEGEFVVGQAVLYANDVMDGEDKQPGETASFVRVPCKSLQLGPVSGDVEEGKHEFDLDSAWWEPRTADAVTRLRSKPVDRATGVRVDVAAVQVVRRQGAWLFAQARGQNVTVRGWIRNADLKKLPDEVGVASAQMCMGDHGPNEINGLSSSEWSARGYSGWATVRAGARVLSSPSVGEWATITEAAKVYVSFERGEKWVYLYTAPGVQTEGTMKAHVSIDDVEMPPEGSADGGR